MTNLNQKTGKNDSTNGNCNGKHKIKYRDKFPNNEMLLTLSAYIFKTRNDTPPNNLLSIQPATLTNSRVIVGVILSVSKSMLPRWSNTRRTVWVVIAARWSDRRAQKMKLSTQQLHKYNIDHKSKTLRRLVCYLNSWKLPDSSAKLTDVSPLLVTL